MLFESGSNRNHYQPAEVNSGSSSSSSSAFQSNLAFPPRSSGERDSWNLGLHNSSNQIGLGLLLHQQQQQQQQQQLLQQQQQSYISSSSSSSSGGGSSILRESPVPAPTAESDSVNNNSHNNNHHQLLLQRSSNSNNNNNNGIHENPSSCHNVVVNRITSPSSSPSSRKNDNECASEILSELDLVASINISLKKQQQQQQQQGNSNVSSSHNNNLTTTTNTITDSTVVDCGLASGSGVIITNNPSSHSITTVNTTNTAANSASASSPKVPITMSDAYLSGVMPESLKNNNNNLRQGPLSAPNTPETMRKHQLLRQNLPILSHSMYVSAKKEKMEFNQMMMKMTERDRPLSYHGRSYESNSSPSILTTAVNKRHVGSASSSSSSLSSSSGTRSRKEATLLNRRSMPSPFLENRFREKFDVSALDTNLPRIDLEAIENHLRLAKEEERKRRSDREEIRRRLALESEDVYEKPNGRKPSLHTRLQSSMNLQICFMNETASDSESPSSDTESKNQQQPASLPHVKSGKNDSSESSGCAKEDFYTRQARLQAEAKQALSQAKEMARLQMEKEHTSPITDMVRNSLLKVGVTLPPERRRVSRQLLTEMNVAQLQVIVNDLHTHIEVLNETLVSMLLERDDLHMEQDSLLVDIEDATRYLQAKESSNSLHSLPLISSRGLLSKK